MDAKRLEIRAIVEEAQAEKELSIEWDKVRLIWFCMIMLNVEMSVSYILMRVPRQS